MTMKKRIFLSNTLMVLISLLILFGIGGFSVMLFQDEFMNVVEQNAELSDDIYAVQTLLMEEQKNPSPWEELSRKLQVYSFELYVSDQNHAEQYSNARHSEMECIEELEDTEFQASGVKLYSMENVTIAKCMVSTGTEAYYVYATYYPGELSLWGMDRGMFEMFIIVFIIAGIIIIAGLLVCSQIFTKLMIKRIMKPVDELNMAARRINDGNFDESIVYQEQDEFGEVCHTFNAMQEHLKSGIERSVAYERARTEMVSGISHDLRTPLTSVKAFIKGMLDGVASTPEKQKQYLTISYQKACDMEMLLQKLFFFSKLETGNMPFFFQNTELRKWMQNYVEDKQAEGENKGYSISLFAEPGDYPVDIDTEQIKRVFDNLIENSLKYAEAKELQMTVTMKRTGDRVCLVFADNGTGMDEDKLPHVFEQFYRGDESRNSGNDGSGLGLYVCRYIIEEHHGTITACSENGFLLRIELPVRQEE